MRARRGLAALALVPLVLTLALACSKDDPDQENLYVALGDSFAAAPYVPVTETESGCLRSSGNYPHLVAAEHPELRLVDVSCSGATTGAMTQVQERDGKSVPAQLDALTKETGLVTLSIGGNDYNLTGTLFGRCPQVRALEPHGSPCKDELTALGTETLAEVTAKIGANVEAVLTAVRERSPDARIIVVGYGTYFPESGTCPDLLPFADGDIRFARRVLVELNRAAQGAAEQGGAEFLDTATPTAGHDICARDPWINGQLTDERAALAYHPFAAEHEAIAALLLALL